MAALVLFNKPYGVLSQFTDGDNRPTLAQYIKLPNVYPAGRLDHDSEGLLLLTDDGNLQHYISHPAHKQPKTYWVQVEGAPNSYALTRLRQGVELNDGMTQPADVRLIPPPALWERVPPIRERASIPTQWLEVVITEGRNRQVRRMTAAVGHPTLRLVRVKIGNWTLAGLEPGKFRVETVQVPAVALKPRGRPARTSSLPGKSTTTSRAVAGGEQRVGVKNTSTKNTPGKSPTQRKNTPSSNPRAGKPRTTTTPVVIQKNRRKPKPDER